MAQPASVRNPFLMMISPEVVLAAVEKSERLKQLQRQTCRPLDRPAPAQGSKQADDSDDADHDIDSAD